MQYNSNTVSRYWWRCSGWADCRAKRSISLSHEGRCLNDCDFWIQGLRFTRRRSDWQRRWRSFIYPHLCSLGTCCGTNWGLICWKRSWCWRGRCWRHRGGVRGVRGRPLGRKRRWGYICRRRSRTGRCRGRKRRGTGRRIAVGPNWRRRGLRGIRGVGWRTRKRSKHDNLWRSRRPSIHYKSWFWWRETVVQGDLDRWFLM